MTLGMLNAMCADLCCTQGKTQEGQLAQQYGKLGASGYEELEEKESVRACVCICVCVSMRVCLCVVGNRVVCMFIIQRTRLLRGPC